jgi:hypothetical protein
MKNLKNYAEKNMLNKIQQNLKAVKGEKNDFGGYNYRSAEGILEAVKPLLGDAALVLTDEIVEVGGRIYVKATAILNGNEGRWEATAYAREPLSRKGMDESQITGAASSYARKYALSGLFCIDNNKDADTMDNREVQGSTYGAAKKKLAGCTNVKTLAYVWGELSDAEKNHLSMFKDDLKTRLSEVE